MTYKYEAGKSPIFSGAVFTDSGKLSQAYVPGDSAIQVVPYTPIPASAVSNDGSVGNLSFIRNLWMTIEYDGTEYFRKQIRHLPSVVSIPEEVVASLFGIWFDAGRPIDQSSNLRVWMYGPKGLGIYWLSRAPVNSLF